MEECMAAIQQAQLPIIQDLSHQSVDTSDEHFLQLFGENGTIPDGQVLIKNILFKDKKKKKLFLIVTTHDAAYNSKLVKKLVGAKGDLRMANADVLEKVLNTRVGCLNPLAVMFDQGNEVKVILDAAVDNAQVMLIHPMDNSRTIGMNVADVKTFIEAQGNELDIVDLSSALRGIETPSVENSEQKQESKILEEKKEELRDQRGIETRKEVNFGVWYSEVVTKCEMIDTSDVSGCYILRPWSYFIWEQIQRYFDDRIKLSGVKNCYFPLFVTEEKLSREASHIEGFSPEVAWVTHAGNSELAERIAIRPTSETIMYPSFSKWIRSYRDLPLRLNQWSNVVRWEFKNPTPFIRSREFLWQEGHSAFATYEEAESEMLEILDLYAQVYEDLLAIPVTKGYKSEKEKFAGAKETTTVEIFVPAAERGIQAATSHCLGTNFAEMFKIIYEDQNSKKQHVYQNSWGLSTRSIGALVMVHSDNKGLVLPPRVAPVQVVIIPIHPDNNDFRNKIQETYETLRNAGLRVELDMSTKQSAGSKFYDWEMKGVPIRLELGPKDYKKEQFLLCRRDTGAKSAVKWDSLTESLIIEMDNMQRDLYQRAREREATLIFSETTWEGFLNALRQGGRALVPWCNTVDCEMSVRERSSNDKYASPGGLSGSAKSLCRPLEEPELIDEDIACFACDRKARYRTFFGRSF